jgi:hypothetical protein
MCSTNSELKHFICCLNCEDSEFFFDRDVKDILLPRRYQIGANRIHVFYTFRPLCLAHVEISLPRVWPAGLPDGKFSNQKFQFG